MVAAPERTGRDSNRLEAAAAPDATGARDFPVVFDRSLHRIAQRRLQAIARERQEISGRLAARLLEIVAGRAMERVHIEVRIDQYGCRREALEQGALEGVDGASVVARGRPTAPLLRSSWRRPPAGNRRYRGASARSGDRSATWTPPETGSRVRRRSRRTKKQVPCSRSANGTGQHLPLDFRFQVDQQVAAADQIQAREGGSCSRFCGAKVIASRNSLLAT